VGGAADVAIGAKVCDYATRALERWPGSTVAAIEPHPPSFARLHRRVAGRISLVQFEFNEMNVISRTFLRDFVGLLPGYRLYRLLPDGMASLEGEPLFVREIFAFQNLVAVRSGVRTVASNDAEPM
jgi:hypothetical protein